MNFMLLSCCCCLITFNDGLVACCRWCWRCCHFVISFFVFFVSKLFFSLVFFLHWKLIYISHISRFNCSTLVLRFTQKQTEVNKMKERILSVKSVKNHSTIYIQFAPARRNGVFGNPISRFVSDSLRCVRCVHNSLRMVAPRVEIALLLCLFYLSPRARIHRWTLIIPLKLHSRVDSHQTDSFSPFGFVTWRFRSSLSQKFRRVESHDEHRKKSQKLPGCAEQLSPKKNYGSIP